MTVKWYKDPTNHLNLFRDSREPAQRAVPLCTEHAMEHSAHLESHRNIKSHRHKCILCYIEEGPEIRKTLVEYGKNTGISVGPNYNPFFLIVSLIADLLFYARTNANGPTISPHSIAADVWKQYHLMMEDWEREEREYHEQRQN